ncbi:MAG: PDZ domain-containing protein [Candidatus Eisenbacteria bacterium]|uniref:Tricorn protease homolog n=1 Tax=Eiseniibacteriota bacterium TaxID=2212470 RepID=A0A937X7C8_UNCEI|nr:PDZ domain-containing protein [Candidatus Eisenbacteria bacterium]
MHPAIHGESIVFCSDDDLWTVGIEGGIARRLTVSKGSVSRPVFSPDGRWIAFTGTDEGGTEVYIVPADGGEPRRLTFFGVTTYPAAWAHDGQDVLCASDAGQPFPGDFHLHAVPISGGPPRALALGPARGLALEPDGPGRALARHGGDPARWKRYRGGTCGTIWVDERGTGEFAQILKTLKGNLASPMWGEGRLYFISDHEGIGNLYSVRPGGRGAVRRHTHHEDFYARFPGSDGRRIVYHAGADLHLFDARTGDGAPIPIEIRSARPQRQRKFVGGNRLEDYDPHPAGHSAVLTVRGRPVAMGLWDGPATEFGAPWRGRHRLARWLSDGKRIVAVTDEPGEEQLEIFTPGRGVERVDLEVDLGRVTDLAVAPAPTGDGGEAAGARRGRRKMRPAKAPAHDRVAVTNHRQEVYIVDLTARRARRVDGSGFHRIAGIDWSPDGRYLAYSLAVDRRHMAIRVADSRSGAVRQVTGGDFIDYAPRFDPEGRYLYFLSLRTFDPVYDLIQFGLGFPRGSKPHLITLRAEETSPFSPPPRPLGPGGKGKEAALLGRNPWDAAPDDQARPADARARKRAEPGEPTRIDFAGIGERILSFPVPEGRYRDIGAIPGKVFFLAEPIEGSLGMSWYPGVPAANCSIELYDLREQKAATFAGGVSDFRVAADRQTMVYRAGARLRAVLATGEPGKLPSGDEPGRATGWIDLGRVRCSVEPVHEWRQMVRETWRLQRDQFWVPDMSRVDWRRVYERYIPLVERISTRGELADLIWEMQGELGTSHAYELGGDYRVPPRYGVGFLGADLAYDRRAKAWKVVRLPRGDSWNPKQSSPLAAPGLGVQPGTRIHAVGGIEVAADLSPQACLVHAAGQDVWLTVSDPAGDGRRPGRGARGKAMARLAEGDSGAASPTKPGERRTITVTTLATEHALRYRDWVERNRAYVHEKSRGRIGYVHIPNMGPWGYAEFHRYFLSELDRRGLIVDARHNGGGHVSQLLLDKLLRRRVGFNVSRHMGAEPYPSEAPRGPLVALTDELAGSDGDIFSHAWKLFRLGPLVGKRTWGGVIGIWPRHPLVDGSVTTQPEFSFWFEDVGWGVENYGTDPDIEVDFRPQDHAAGRDPQLDRGLEVILRLESRFREKLPDMTMRPDRSLPALPMAGAPARPARRA